MNRPWFETFFGEDYSRYDHHPDTDAEVELILRHLAHAQTVADVGCGYGRHSAALANSGKTMLGIDLSPELLEQASQQTAEDDSGTPYYARGDMRCLPLADESIDGVVSMYSSLGYFDDEDENYAVVAEFGRVLKAGGRAVIETVNRDYVLRLFQSKAWYTRSGLTVLESRTFDPVASRSEVDVTVIQGASRRTYRHSIRLYTATELSMLLASVGLVVT